MSTAQLYLSEQEIEELVRDIPQDTSILYGEEKQEFGVCPYITFYIYHEKNHIDKLANTIIDIYEVFESQLIDKPFKLRYQNSSSEWKNADQSKKNRQQLIEEMEKCIQDNLIYFIGATTGYSEIQSARWVFQSSIRLVPTRYSSIKITFGDRWYRSNKEVWYSFVQKCLEKFNPIQAYSGYEIGNTSQQAFVVPEFETVERTFTDYFYGIDIDHPSKMSTNSHNDIDYLNENVLGAGIRTPTWCFLLSPYWLEKLDLNEQQIREKLNDPRIEITKIVDPEDSTKYSLWIRLGELSLYPVEEGIPDLLVMANELIKPIRCDNMKLTTLDAWDDDPNPRFDAVSSKQWIARFDKDSTWPELKSVEIEVQEEERIDIVIAGSPCPHAGYWYTFAKENSRQYFKQGDIFPDFESDWGDVYWQFDG